jgi:superfamily II DNA or RNA helicase
MGTITEGKINVSDGITFATVQTMAKINLSDFHDFFDVVIVDEAHRCVGTPTSLTMFYKVVSSLSARYKFGLTATPKRTDGMERAMFALLGEKFFEITKEDVKDKICNVHVQAFETNYEPNYDSVLMPDGTLNYSELVNDLIQNEERFQKVLDVINKLSSPILVLSSRVSYAQKLSDAYNGRSICLSAFGQSKKAKIIRQDALSKLNNGELEAVFCTYQLASEGLDVPSLRYVVFATPEKNPIRIQQSTGRVSRKADGKQCGTVIDFIDDFRMYKGWWVKRKSIYKKLGYDII